MKTNIYVILAASIFLLAANPTLAQNRTGRLPFGADRHEPGAAPSSVRAGKAETVIGNGLPTAVPGDLDPTFGVREKVITPIGREGGRISAIAIQSDGKRSTTKAGASGDTWISNGPNATIFSIIVDPTNSNVLYALAAHMRAGVFKSVDKGATWLPSGRGFGSLGVWCVAIDPQDARILYAGTNDGVYKTVDAGGTWSLTSGPQGLIYAVGVAPSDPRIIYAGTFYDIFVSSDGGDSWSLASPVLDPGFLDKIVVDPSDPSVVYAAYNLDNDTFFSYLSKSTDSGTTFARLEVEETGGQLIFALRIDAVDPRLLHVAAPYGIYRTTDGGAIWYHSPFFGGTSALAVMPLQAGHLFTSFYDTNGYSQGVSESTDDGGTWTGVGTGLAKLQIYDLELDSSGTQLYAATQSGVFSVRVREDAVFVSISGRVTTPDGRGLRNATVFLTDSLGVRRTATTSSFGFYSFDDVRAGDTYVIGMSSRLYRFASRNLVLTESLANVDFVGLE